jgi:hypothetical protein
VPGGRGVRRGSSALAQGCCTYGRAWVAPGEVARQLARRARRARHAQIASQPPHQPPGTPISAHADTECRHRVPARRRKRARPDHDAAEAHLEDFSIIKGAPRLAQLPSIQTQHPAVSSRLSPAGMGRLAIADSRLGES